MKERDPNKVSLFYPAPKITPLRHEGNTSNGGAKSANSTAFQLKYRLYLIGHLLRRAFWRK